jgi:ribonucleotide reductase class II
VTHNTSATWELRFQEAEAFGDCIYRSIQKGEYISGAILARFDDYQSFPRLPFEPISKETYERLLAECLKRRKHSDFHVLMNQRIAEIEHYDDSPQDMACSGLKCEVDINSHKS